MSLKNKFILSVLVGMLPVVAALLFLTFYAYLPARNAVDDIHHLYQAQVLPVMRAQTAMYQSAMPPNDFIISGDPDERELFARYSKNVEQELALIAQAHPEPESQNRIANAREEWAHSKALANQMFALNDVDRKALASVVLMKRFDANIHELADQIGALHVHVEEEVRQRLQQTEHRRTVGLIVLIASLIGGMVLAVLASVWTVGSILRSVSRLFAGVDALRTGRIDHLTGRDAPSGEFGSLFDAFNTLSEFVLAERIRLEQHAMTDSLTGLYNRDVLFTMMHTEVDRLTAHPENRRGGDKDSFSFLMIDLDHFKSINDTYGHPAGDAVLKAVSHVVRHLIRSSDCVGRYGGEEIGVYLAATGPAGARQLAERIRESIAALAVDSGDGRIISVTASIGGATFPIDGKTSEALVKAADLSLYKAKQSGRNRVCLASEEE